jgi:general stress protein YciG
MAGTQEGGRKAAATNRVKYGDGTKGRPDFYREIGRKGGKLSKGGGFAYNIDLAREAGRKGGKASRRTKTNG